MKINCPKCNTVHEIKGVRPGRKLECSCHHKFILSEKQIVEITQETIRNLNLELELAAEEQALAPVEQKHVEHPGVLPQISPDADLSRTICKKCGERLNTENLDPGETFDCPDCGEINVVGQTSKSESKKHKAKEKLKNEIKKKFDKSIYSRKKAGLIYLFSAAALLTIVAGVITATSSFGGEDNLIRKYLKKCRKALNISSSDNNDKDDIKHELAAMHKSLQEKQVVEKSEVAPINEESRIKIEEIGIKEENQEAEKAVADKTDEKQNQTEKNTPAAIEKVLKSLSNKISPLVKEQQYEKASEILRSYSGELKTETEAPRLELAKLYEKLATDKKKQYVQKVMSEIAGKILKSNFNDALALCESKKDPKNDSLNSNLDVISKQLKILKNSEKYVFKSFKAQKGQEISLVIKDQLKMVKIKNVTKNYLTVQEKVGKAMLGIKVKFEDLEDKEKCRRLAVYNKTAAVIYAGICEFRRKNYDKAAKYFKNTGALADILVAETQAFNHNEDDHEGIESKVKTQELTEKSLTKTIKTPNHTEIDPKKLAIDVFVKRNKRKADNFDYDDKEQKIKFRSVFNNRAKVKISNFSIKLLIIGQSVTDKKKFKILNIFTDSLNVEAMKTYTSQEVEFRVMYDDNRSMKYGYKYYTNLVIVKDDKGKMFKYKCVRSKFSKLCEKIDEFEKDCVFDLKGKKIQERNRYYY